MSMAEDITEAIQYIKSLGCSCPNGHSPFKCDVEDCKYRKAMLTVTEAAEFYVLERIKNS